MLGPAIPALSRVSAASEPCALAPVAGDAAGSTAGAGAGAEAPPPRVRFAARLAAGDFGFSGESASSIWMTSPLFAALSACLPLADFTACGEALTGSAPSASRCLFLLLVSGLSSLPACDLAVCWKLEQGSESESASGCAEESRLCVHPASNSSLLILDNCSTRGPKVSFGEHSYEQTEDGGNSRTQPSFNTALEATVCPCCILLAQHAVFGMHYGQCLHRP